MEGIRICRTLALAAALCSGLADADSVCYTTKAYPQVDFLQSLNTGDVAFLAQPLGRDASRSSYTMARMQGDAEGFTAGGEVDCEWDRCEGFKRLDACPKDMPEIRIAEENVPEHMKERWPDLEQAPGACAIVGDEVYFGLAFYGGEGMIGLGGVGRWNRATGELEVRHPERLRDVSINHLAFDGERLWIGTYYDSECSGEIPERRVLVYDWNKDRFEYGQGLSNPLTCGFVANGFVQTAPNVMWVASDLGLTRVDFGQMQDSSYFGDRILYGPTHWWAVETPDGPRMRKGDCRELYSELLETLPVEPVPTYMSVLEQFVGSLQRFESGFLRNDYLRRVHEERGLEQMTFAFRNVDGRIAIQACESGEIFLPKGSGWWWAGLDQRQPAGETLPGTAARNVMLGAVLPVAAEPGEKYRGLRYADRGTGDAKPAGACAGEST